MSNNNETSAVERLMRPASVAIVGMSLKPGSAGLTVLSNLELNEFPGPIHLVGRSGGEINGRPILTDVEQLPEGVDLAVLVMPAAAIEAGVAGCVARAVRTAIIFASGFAELGDEGRRVQQSFEAMAREGGLAIVGPNCLGYTNYRDGIAIGFAGAQKMERVPADAGPTVAVLAQSGGLGGHVLWALRARGIHASYSITTGNEAGLGLADFIDYLIADDGVGVISIYGEDIRRPADFMAAVGRARAAGKPVVMIHPGSSVKGQAAAGSHTGALAGDDATMRTLVRHAGVALVDTLDELVDVTELLLRYPTPKPGGAGVLTCSGAFCAIAHDTFERMGIEIAPLGAATVEHLAKRVPAFIPPNNPLDLGTQPIWEPDLVGYGAAALLADPAIASLTCSLPSGGPKAGPIYLQGLADASRGNPKPMIVALLGDETPLPAEVVEIARANRIVLSRSSDRAMAAMGQVIHYAERAAAYVRPAEPVKFEGLPTLGTGPQPEWLGKQLLAKIGLKVPKGALAKSADEAADIAASIGYPVAIKAQAAALTHKTEAGGVRLNLTDDAALRQAYDAMVEIVARYQPGLVLDGILIEAMSARGVELALGARRDPKWGPILMLGLGGIWIEAMNDVVLLPPDLDEANILAALKRLRSAKLLTGIRGQAPSDVKAVAKAAAAIGRLMLTEPSIVEIDVNPLMVHAEGAGATALDALIVTA